MIRIHLSRENYGETLVDEKIKGLIFFLFDLAYERMQIGSFCWCTGLLRRWAFFVLPGWALMDEKFVRGRQLFLIINSFANNEKNKRSI